MPIKKRRQVTPPTFQHVALVVSQPGQSVVHCTVDDPRATTFYVNQKGERYSATRPIANIFAVEVRSTRRMTGACRELLHTETWEQPLDTKPEIPANTLFIAKAFELAAQ